MAADHASTPTTPLRVQSCGDAHVVNFGVFAAPDRRLVFDLNDFDETLPAPFEWDVKRLATSLVVAARDNGFRGRDRAAARAAVRAYHRRSWPSSRAWGSSTCGTRASTSIRSSRQLERRGTGAAPTRRPISPPKRTSLGSLARFVEKADGGYRIKLAPPVIVPVAEEPGHCSTPSTMVAWRSSSACDAPRTQGRLRGTRSASAGRHGRPPGRPRSSLEAVAPDKE